MKKEKQNDAAEAFDLRAFMPAQLALLSHLTQSLLASALDTCDMTIAQWRVSICLVKQGPGTLNDIVRFTLLPQSSLSRSIARMEQRGLVRIRREPQDRRRSLIEITDAGRERLAQAIGIVEERCDVALRLEPEELESFQKTVARLIARLSPKG